MVPILESLHSFPVPFAIWRVSDQVIEYANESALREFGANEHFLGQVTLWDVVGPLDQNLIVVESIRSDPNGGPDIHLPDEAFATFKRQDDGSLFTGWYRATDIADRMGTVTHRAALIFTDYDSYEDGRNWDEFIQLRAQRIERELAASVSHRLNNSLAMLEAELERMRHQSGVDFRSRLAPSLDRLRDIGHQMNQLAHVSDSIRESNSQDVFARIMPSIDRPDSLSHHGMRVLLVDDEIPLLEGLSAVMTMRGVIADTASNGRMALERLEKFRPDAVLIDIVLGDENGIELGEQIAKQAPNATIVYMTGYSNIAPKMATKNALPILKKPFEIDLAISLLAKGRRIEHDN